MSSGGAGVASAAPVAGTPTPQETRPIGPAAFVAVAVAALGGPLALAALYAPQVVVGVTGSAGLVALAGAAAFVFPLVVWLRYARHVNGAAGLAGFVERAAGRRAALVQATVWAVSYVLYLCYTGAYVVYDVLPAAVPGVTPYRPVLELVLPVAVAAAVVAPRSVTLGVLAVLAVAQVGLAGWLAVLGVATGSPAAFAATAPAGQLTQAGGNLAVLYVCGSLPVFLGAEVTRPARTVRRGLVLAYGLVAVLVTLAVLPVARTPAVSRAEIPGMLLASAYGGRTAGTVVGLGVAASVVGVMLVEYVAVTRLVHGTTRLRVPTVARALAVPLVVAGPVSLLVGPERFYADLLRPSLVALWVSQLIVIVVYPLFARRHGGIRVRDVVLTVGATAVTAFGLYTSLAHQVLS